MSSPNPPDRRRRRRTSEPTPNRDRLSTLRSRRRAGEPPPNRDRLSTLEDGILHRILSHLPLDSAVRTSALSSRYRHVWRTNPSLVFPSFTDLADNIHPDDYINAVDSSLDLCSSTEHLATLSFTIDQFGSYFERRETASRWADFAAVRLVDCLSFTFKYPADDPDEYEENEFDWLVPLPESFFCCWSIVTLKLDHCAIPLISVELGRPIFPFLETVFLRSVAFTEDSLSEFISASPKIKKLNIAGSKFTDPIVITSSTMETLDVYNNVFHIAGPVSIKFAPKLRFLGLCCDLTTVESVRLANLEEAVLLSGTLKKFDERNEWRLLVSAVKNAKVLVVDDWFTEFTLNGDIDFGFRPPVFSNLVKLVFCGNPSGLNWVRGLLHNISECPILEELYIRLECNWSRRVRNSSFFDEFNDEDTVSSDNEDKQIPKNNSEDEKLLEELKKNIHVIPPLKTIKIEGYNEEPAVATLIEFFLYKASVLNSVVIYYNEDCQERSEEIIEKMRVIRTISRNVEIITRDESDLKERKLRHDVCWNPICYD